MGLMLNSTINKLTVGQGRKSNAKAVSRMEIDHCSTAPNESTAKSSSRQMPHRRGEGRRGTSVGSRRALERRSSGLVEITAFIEQPSHRLTRLKSSIQNFPLIRTLPGR